MARSLKDSTRHTRALVPDSDASDSDAEGDPNKEPLVESYQEIQWNRLGRQDAYHKIRGKEDEQSGPEAVAREVMRKLLEARRALKDGFDGENMAKGVERSELPCGDKYNAWKLAWQTPQPMNLPDLDLNEGGGDSESGGMCKLVQIFEALGPYQWQGTFLRCMAMDVGKELKLAGKNSGSEVFILPRKGDRLYLFEGFELVPGEDERNDEGKRITKENIGEESVALIKRNVRDENSAWERHNWFGGTRSVHGIAYAWTPLFNKNLSTKARIYFLKSMIDADRSNQVFGTWVGQIFANESWDKIKTLFYIDKLLLETISLTIIMYIGYCIRSQAQPSGAPMTVLIILNSKSMINILVELIMCLRLFGLRSPWQGFRRYLSGWNVAFLAIEIFTFFTLVWATSKTEFGGVCKHSKGADGVNETCWYLSHPIWFMFVVLGKCMYYLVNLLCYQPFGEQVYVAYATLIHPSSVWFSIFIVLCVFSCIASYYMFPIAENMMDTTGHMPAVADITDIWNWRLPDASNMYPLMTTAMKVFRLTIMGDFDVWELEGVDGVIQKNGNGSISSAADGDTVYTTDDGDPSPVYHIGVQVFLVITAFFFNVLVLNVYIGLMGSVYGKMDAVRVEIFSEFRSTFAFKELLLKQFHVKLMGLCGYNEECDESFNQYFILYDTRLEEDIKCLDAKGDVSAKLGLGQG